MRPTHEMTPAELRSAAYDALVRELGVTGFIRYLRDAELGSGDYTKTRHKHLPQTFEELDALMRGGAGEPKPPESKSP